MLEFRLREIRCQVSLLFPALLTVLMWRQPEGVAVMCVLASLMHEGGHLLAMLLVGVPPEDCVLGVFGLRIRINECVSGYKDNLLISLSGPLVNGIAAGVLGLCNATVPATVHLSMAVVNLMPSIGLDGGEILRCGLGLMGFDGLAIVLLRITSVLTLSLFLGGGFWLFMQDLSNPTLLIVGVYLTVLVFFSKKNEKTLDKIRGCWYNRRDE